MFCLSGLLGLTYFPYLFGEVNFDKLTKIIAYNISEPCYQIATAYECTPHLLSFLIHWQHVLFEWQILFYFDGFFLLLLLLFIYFILFFFIIIIIIIYFIFFIFLFFYK